MEGKEEVMEGEGRREEEGRRDGEEGRTVSVAVLAHWVMPCEATAHTTSVPLSCSPATPHALCSSCVRRPTRILMNFTPLQMLAEAVLHWMVEGL